MHPDFTSQGHNSKSHHGEEVNWRCHFVELDISSSAIFCYPDKAQYWPEYAAREALLTERLKPPQEAIGVFECGLSD